MITTTTNMLQRIAAPDASPGNIASVALVIDAYGKPTGIDQPHRLAQFVAQLAHESGGFKFDRELWGPTPAQVRYERDFTQPWTKDNPRNKLAFQLGNVNKGDGRKYSGKGPIQLTGRGNVTRFYGWAVDKGFMPPNFIDNPDLINTDPWEGLAAIWYWDEGNPTGKSLNVYADEGNNEMITRRINGGLNGYADRLEKYSIIGLAMLGFTYTKTQRFKFQTEAKELGVYTGEIDGDDGPKTRSAIHQMLVKSGTVPAIETKPAPVTEPVPVTPKGADAVVMTRTIGGTGFVSLVTSLLADIPPWAKVALVGIAGVALIVMVWKQELIASRVRSAIKAFGLGS